MSILCVTKELEQRADDFLSQLSAGKKENIYAIIEAKFVNRLASQAGIYWQNKALRDEGLESETSVTTFRKDGANLLRALKISKKNGHVISQGLKNFMQKSREIINELKEAELNQ
jgi:hypothetical protein